MTRTKPRSILASIATLAAIGLAGVLSSHAKLLLYEGFNYAEGSFTTGVYGTGMGFAAASMWKTDDSGTETTASNALRYVFDGVPNTPVALPGETWNGVFNGLTGSGNFVGVNGGAGEHLYFIRPVHPATFAPHLTNGQTLWMSYVANGGSSNNRRTGLVLSSGQGFQDRGKSLGTTQGGEAAGACTSATIFSGTTVTYNRQIYPVTYKDLSSDGTSEQLAVSTTNNSGELTAGDHLIIVKFQWGATDADPDTVSVYNLSEPVAGTTNLSSVITESFFDLNAKSVTQVLNQTAFTSLLGMSIHSFAHFDEIRMGTTFDDVIGNTGPVPTITAVGSPLAAMSTTQGTPSTATFFTVSGTMMTEGVLVTAPAGFEVSQSESSGYAGTTAVGTAGTIETTTVYVRLSATAQTAGDYNAKHIVLSSTGAAIVNVTTAASGNTVWPEFPAEITALGSPLTAVSTTYGTPSAATSFTVSGTYMLTGILVTAPAGFEVSLSEIGGYAGTITVGAAGTIDITPVYVRLAATAAAAGTYNARNIVLSSLTAVSVNVTTAESGNTVTPKPLTVTATGPTKIYGTTLDAGPTTMNFTAGAAGVGSEVVTSVTLTPDAAGASPATTTGTAYVITASSAAGTGGFLASNYDITYIPYSGTVTIATPILSITNSPVLYDGSAHAAAVSASVDGIVGNVRYNGADTLPTATGTYAVTADFTPTDNTNYLSLNAAPAGNLIIVKHEIMMVNVQFFSSSSSAPSMINRQGPVPSYSTTPYWNRFGSTTPRYGVFTVNSALLTQADGSPSPITFTQTGARADSWSPAAGEIKMFTGVAYLDVAGQTITSVFSGLTVGQTYDLYAMSSAGSLSDMRVTVNSGPAVRLRGNASAAGTIDATNDYTQFITSGVDAAGDDFVSTANTAYFKQLNPDANGKLTIVVSYANAHRVPPNEPFLCLSGYQLAQVANSPYDTWTNGYNWAALNNPDYSPAGNPDGDTLNNLLEYAFGTDPTVSTTGEIVYDGTHVITPGSPVLVEEAAVFDVVFGRRADYLAAGLTYTVQFSTGLDVWVDNNEIDNPPQEITTDGSIHAVRVPYPESMTIGGVPQKPTFSRVRVTMP